MTSPSPVGASTAANAANAVGYAHAHGYRSSIGVLDTQTGSFAGAGDYNSSYASESVMKVFIATRLLLTGQMTGWNATTAYKMITQSDDASADALYGRTGGDSVITWIKQALNIPNLGSPPLRSGWWGGTQITAAGMASFYNAVRHRPTVWNWLGNAMHHATVYGSDGTYQYFGIPSATSGAAIKQGWGGDDAAGQPAFNSTGVVNGDRYAVVILTQGGVYGSPIANMLTSEARLLMPGGRISNDDPVGGVSSWTLHGRYLTVTGWAIDPNSLNSSLRILFLVNGARATVVDSTVYRGDINAHFHATGNHGFSVELPLKDGTNTVCALAGNLGAGASSELGCRTFALSGSPVGAIDRISQHGNVASFTGWAFDYDAPDTALTVVAGIGGRYAGSVVTNLTRSDVNTALHGTGTHGFQLDLRLPAGTTGVCIDAANVGPGSPARLGCASVTVPVSPVGALDSVTVQGNKATVTGWAVDFNAPGQAIGVVINVGSVHAAWGPTPIDRTDVNQEYGITGTHGFSATVTLPNGTSTICGYGVNVGPGSNSLLGCRTVSVTSGAPNAASPAGGSPSASPSAGSSSAGSSSASSAGSSSSSSSSASSPSASPSASSP
ncbi:MAG TPA: hypothetical protein VFU36_03665 [Jatrophihabitans sp.]|nr:hypothetical protein [Jatrophihabitans sp.]